MSEFTPLPWFAFNVEKWLADTKRLDTMGQGAYLLLCLEIYQKGDPLPDDHDVLRAITGLSQTDWSMRRKLLESFFIVKDGLWRHERAERELRSGAELVAKRKAASDAGNAAKSRKPAEAEPKRNQDGAAAQAAPKPQRQKLPNRPSEGDLSGAASVTEPVAEAAAPPASVWEPHLHLQDTSLSKTEGGKGPPPEEFASQGKEESKIGKHSLEPMPDDWQPNEEGIEAAHNAGLTDAEIDSEVTKFRNTAISKDLMSTNWNAGWLVWVERAKGYKAKLAPAAAPRVEVNAPIDWERAVRMWKANNSSWWRNLGPEPGQIGCKCPVEVMEKYGIDPKTGLPKRASA